MKMKNDDLILERLQNHLYTIQSINTDKELLSTLLMIAEKIVETFNNGCKVYFCGNGGSAADAQHLAAEFSGRFYIDRPGLPARHCIVILLF